MDPNTPNQPAPVTAQVVYPSVPSRPRSGGRWFGWLVLLLLLGGFGFVVLLVVGLMGEFSTSGDTHIDERYHSLAKHGSDKIAIISVEGTIIEGDGFAKKQIDHVRDDKAVKAVVLRVDSPGGTVSGSDYIYHHLRKLTEERKIPLVVSMGGMAASGGYYVSMACGETENVIFAEPTTWTGSIGVAIPHYDVSGLMDRLDVSEDTIKSHRLKMMGSPFKEMTEEERAIFQGLVDDSFKRFKEIVKSGRPKFKTDDSALDKLATGQVYTTTQALASGLVDKEGFIEDAIDRAIELAGLDKEDTKVIKFHQPFGLLEGLLAARAKSAQPGLKALLDLTVPRAYFLCTWLPDAMRE